MLNTSRFIQGFKGAEILLHSKLYWEFTRFSHHSIAIWLCTSVYMWECVGSMCYVGSMYYTNTQNCVTDRVDFMLRNRTDLAQSKIQLSQCSTVIIMSRDTVWSCSFHFIWENDFVDTDCLLQPLHPSDLFRGHTLSTIICSGNLFTKSDRFCHLCPSLVSARENPLLKSYV